MRRFVATKRSRSKADKERDQEIHRVTLNMKSKRHNVTAQQILTGDQIGQLGAIMALWARDNHTKGIKDPKGWPVTRKDRIDEEYDEGHDREERLADET